MYHNLGSPVSIKQNLWTLSFSWNLWVSIQLFVLYKYASASLSGFPENLGLKQDQFNGGICGTGCHSACSTRGAGRAGGAGGSLAPYRIGGAWGPSGWAVISL